MTIGADERRERPKPFADDWGARGTTRPPATVANALGAAGRPEAPALVATSVGARFTRYAPRDLAAVPSVDGEGGIDLSPDGTEVAFAWDSSGSLEIYTAPLIGDRIIQLTQAGVASRTPKWSPDARWVAFVRAGAEGRTAVWLVDRDGEHERRLTDAAGYRDHAWSPDGSRIAVVDAAGDIHVLDAERGTGPRIASGSQPQWSPDGGLILFTARGSAAGELGAVPADGGDARVLDTREGKTGVSRDARWSPDGAAIAFTTTVRGHSEVAFARIRDRAVVRVERLGPTPFEDSRPVWRPDARGVVYRRRSDASVSLRRAFTVSHDDDAVADLPGVHCAQCVAPDSDSIVAVLSQATRPADVVVRVRGAIRVARVTSSLPGTIDQGALVEPVAASFDGRLALVYLPHVEASSGPRALVLYRRAAEREWDPVAQSLANAGHVVVASNDATLEARVVARLREARIETRGRAEIDASAVSLLGRDERAHRLEHILSRIQ